MPEVARSPTVIADVRSREGPTTPTRYGDVVVTHPIHRVGSEWKGWQSGKAAAKAERDKFRDYRPSPTGKSVLLVPLAFETYGRWGVRASRELRRLARRKAAAAASAGAFDAASIYRATLLRWRREVSVTWQQGNVAILSACAGQAPSLGANSGPGAEPLDLIVEQH